MDRVKIEHTADGTFAHLNGSFEIWELEELITEMAGGA